MLSDCFRVPDNEISQKIDILSDALATVFPEANFYVSRMKRSIKNKRDRETQMIDFTRLFLGPFSLAAPPYGSVYLEGDRKLMGNSTADVSRRYQEDGLKLSAEFKDMPDHITAELEYMYFLIFKETEAFDASDYVEAQKFIEKQKAFITDHLSIWIPKFNRAIGDNAITDFYKNLAVVTRLLVQRDLEVHLNFQSSENGQKTSACN